MNKYITKVKKSENRIIEVFVDFSWEKIENSIKNIDLKNSIYYTKVNNIDTELEVGVKVIDGNTRKYLRTKPDGKDINNLENLPTEFI